jgi:hypothetical protein
MHRDKPGIKNEFAKLRIREGKDLHTRSMAQRKIKPSVRFPSFEVLAISAV